MDRITPPNFKPEIDRLRGFAILLVVVSHMLALSKDTLLGGAFYTATRGATWPFVFIAGYLFAHLCDRYTYETYLRGKLQNVIAPYLIIVSLIVIAGLARTEFTGPLEFWKYYSLGYTAASPLWFIPMIILIYLGFPCYRALCNSHRLLLVVTGCAIILAMSSGRPSFDAGPLPNFVYFQSAFLFGLSWRVHQELFDALIEKYYPIIILLFVFGINVGMGPVAPFGRGQIFALLPMTILLVAAMRADSPLNRIWEWLADRSFGIFFLHGVVTDQLNARFGRDNDAFLALIGGVALTFACGLLVSLVRHFAGPRSRLIVGA
jgi:peptidoglycan/LPS O-acetylase OafA/YrhL